MSKKKVSNNENSFFYRFKNDKVYNAKIQLISYGVFIVLIIIFLNVSNTGNNYNYNYGNNTTNSVNKIKDNKNDKNLFDKLEDNYSYDINITVGNKKSDNSEEISNYNYNGKSYKDNLIINRRVDNKQDVFYKVSDEYYLKQDGEYKFIDEDIVYTLINSKYIELDGVKKLIDKASLDHVTNEAGGDNEYVYSLKVSDVIKSYKGNEIIDIDVKVTSSNVNINADYSNLFKIMDNGIISCKVNYKYSDISNIEEFKIIDDVKEENSK